MTQSNREGIAASGRATNLEGLGSLLAPMTTDEGIQTGLSIKLRPTDCVISPFGKSGTTWLQQMAHTLRTRGDMDFDDISRVVPWIESSTDLGLDLNAEQRAEPRAFKSHLDAHRIPTGGRYIISCRDPMDAAYSMYKFMEGWFLEPGTVTPDEFTRGTFIAAGNSPDANGGDYWTHLKSWWARRHDSDVLFMAYEHMKKDPTGTIGKVASFMDIELDPELLAITQEHTSLAFMQEHMSHFNDKLMRDRSVALSDLPTNSDSSKVRSGQVGESRLQLGPEVSAELNAIWTRQITPELGFESYAEMIATLE